MTRVCTSCKQIKPAEDYYRQPRTSDGLQSRCKDCMRQNSRRRSQRKAKRPYTLEWSEDGRTCTSCTELKPWDQFSPRPAGKNGRNSVCRTCTAGRRRTYRAANIARVRAVERSWERRTARHLRRTYGMTSDEYAGRVATQDGCCAICKRKPQKRLVVDHCHAGGYVRDLLCDRCNIGLSVLEEPGLLELCQAYLIQHQRA